jgi:hypothetical protein
MGMFFASTEGEALLERRRRTPSSLSTIKTLGGNEMTIPPNYREPGMCCLCKHVEFGHIYEDNKCVKYPEFHIEETHVCDDYDYDFIPNTGDDEMTQPQPPEQSEDVDPEIEFENVYKIHVREVVYTDGSRNVEVRHLVEKDAPHTFCRSLVELANLHIHRDLELMASVKRAPKDQEN